MSVTILDVGLLYRRRIPRGKVDDRTWAAAFVADAMREAMVKFKDAPIWPNSVNYIIVTHGPQSEKVRPDYHWVRIETRALCEHEGQVQKGLKRDRAGRYRHRWI